MAIERSFFHPPFLTILKPLERTEIMFSHRKSVKKPFFSYNLPRGSCFAKIRVSCQTSKMEIEGSFFHPHFDHFKTTGKVRNHVFSSEECYKSLFLII